MGTNNFKLFGLIGGVVLIIILVLIAFPVAFVGVGERGVIFDNFSGVQDRILGEGYHFRKPFIETVKTLSIKVRKDDVKAEAASKDLQTVTSDIVVNWHLDEKAVNKVYQSIGNEKDVFDRVIAPAVNEVVKASTAQYTAEEVVVKRPLLKDTIDKLLTDRLLAYNVIVDDVSIVNVDFSPEFNEAIEKKSVAIQKAQQAENDLKRIEIEAKQTVETAKAAAESIKIQTEALSQNTNLIQLELAKRWNGVLPSTVLGNSVPLLNLNFAK